MNEMLLPECGYCDGRNGWFDHSEDCENNPENVITNLQAENERITKMLLSILAVIHGDTTAGMTIERSFNRAIDVRNQQIIKMEALQAENERLRAALIESTKFIINTSIPYREGYIWSLIHDRVSDNYAALGYIFPALGYGANHEE